MAERHKRGPRQIAAELGFELVIVFVGVYLASALSDYQERQRQEAHRTQIRRALVAEVGSITSIAKNYADQLVAMTAAIDEQTAAGKRPIPEPMLGGATVAHPMWQATLSSGGLDLFDVNTFNRIARFYGELDDGLTALDKLDRLSIQELVPKVGMPETEYYLPNGALKPKYFWYRQQINSVLSAARAMGVIGDSLVAELGDSTQRATQRRIK